MYRDQAGYKKGQKWKVAVALNFKDLKAEVTRCVSANRLRH